MRNITPERLTSFIEIYKEATGRLLTTEEAHAVLDRLIPLYQLLMRPLPHEREARNKQRTIGLKPLEECPDVGDDIK